MRCRELSCYKRGWRMGWDSNPRWACTHAGFQDRCLKPLGHPSTQGNQASSRPPHVLKTQNWHPIGTAGLLFRPSSVPVPRSQRCLDRRSCDRIGLAEKVRVRVQGHGRIRVPEPPADGNINVENRNSFRSDDQRSGSGAATWARTRGFISGRSRGADSRAAVRQIEARPDGSSAKDAGPCG